MKRVPTPTDVREAITSVSCDLLRLQSLLGVISDRLHEDSMPTTDAQRRRHVMDTWHLVDIARAFTEDVEGQADVADDLARADLGKGVRHAA